MELKWPDDTAESDAAQKETLELVRALLPASAEDVSPEDRRKHLSFIQAIVTRMSQASSSSKTWLLPIVTLTYGYAITKSQSWIAVLGPLVIFGLLNANYLQQERAFRKLYDKVTSGGDIPAFSLNPALAEPAGTKVNYWPDWEDVRSWAVAPIYGPLLVAGIRDSYLGPLHLTDTRSVPLLSLGSFHLQLGARVSLTAAKASPQTRPHG